MCMRSKFEVFMEVLVVFRTHGSMRVLTLMRKANLSSNRKNDIVDLLLANNLIMVDDGNYLMLTDKGWLLANELVPKYKDIKKVYIENFDL